MIRVECQKKWDLVIESMVEDCEHKADKWDVACTFEYIDLQEDMTNKIIRLKGSKFVIDWIKKTHFEPLKTNFRKVFPEYTFELKEITIKRE